MKVLFLNLPYIEKRDGAICTGPTSGSCWPHTFPGLYAYVPFPFFMANATSYAQASGVDATMFDAWAYRFTDYDSIIGAATSQKFDMVVIETATPCITQILSVAEKVKSILGCKIVLTGSHCAAYAQELLALPYVDHVVKGEYDLACLKIAEGDTRRLIEHEYVSDIDNVNGKNWLPYRDPGCIANYLDPCMDHTPIQLQVNTSRGCNYACSYCSWPATMYRRRFARSAENVLDEIRQCVSQFSIRSIFFDDEMFNAGDPKRLEAIADGLKQIGLPWSFMGRIDTSKHEMIERFVDSGCVGMRFGVESFHQHLLDRVNKKLNVDKSREMCRWILSHFKGIHVRLLTMKQLPGETANEEALDDQEFKAMKYFGESHGNRVDIQTSNCIALPGTPLWNEMMANGERERLENFSEHSALPQANSQIPAIYSMTVKGK